MSNIEKEKLKLAWCIAANIVYGRSYGQGGKEKRSGTKSFAPGAKVYVVDFFWGMGGENITVTGRHRKSHRYITLITQAKWLANWRVELVYSPSVIREIISYAAYKPEAKYVELLLRDEGEHWASGQEAKTKAEQIMENMKKWHDAVGQNQPPVTRS